MFASMPASICVPIAILYWFDENCCRFLFFIDFCSFSPLIANFCLCLLANMFVEVAWFSAGHTVTAKHFQISLKLPVRIVLPFSSCTCSCMSQNIWTNLRVMAVHFSSAFKHLIIHMFCKSVYEWAAHNFQGCCNFLSSCCM